MKKQTLLTAFLLALSLSFIIPGVKPTKTYGNTYSIQEVYKGNNGSPEPKKN